MKRNFGVLAMSLIGLSIAGGAHAVDLFSEDFEDVGPLGVPIDEVGRGWDGQNVWTTSPSVGLPGWTLTQAIDGNGAAEWKGWSFAKKDFWVSVAGDQTRSSFTKGIGTIAIADPDEFDDYNVGINNAGYNVFMQTGNISLAGIQSNTVTLQFDSSWRPEGFDDDDLTNNQTGIIKVSFDGGASSEILHWDSDSLGSFFHPDSQNETVLLNIANPNGAQNMTLEFGLTKANNDWWWAVDNITVQGAVPEPATIAALGLGAMALIRRRRGK